MTSFHSAIKKPVIGPVKIKTALVSVFDKSNLDSLAQLFIKYSIKVISTGGTAAQLRDYGCNVTDVTEYTKSPEILGGRVKTLHPIIYGGLLAVNGNAEHDREISELGIANIDMTVCNLYPFEKAVENNRTDCEQCIENIDIGGPCMIRASAKNSHCVTVVTSVSDYPLLIEHLDTNGGSALPEFRKFMARKAFALTARYDSKVAGYLLPEDTLDDVFVQAFDVKAHLKYGCNPHQKPSAMCSVMAANQMPFVLLNGTPGYINLLDAINAWQLVKELQQATGLTAAASFKHVSPAGVAVSSNSLSDEEMRAFDVGMASSSYLSASGLAYIRARNGDPMCSFGDFVAISGTVDLCVALLLKNDVSDGIIAAQFDDDALEILSTKKSGKFIILRGDTKGEIPKMEVRSIGGLGLIQKQNFRVFDESLLKNKVTSEAADLGRQAIIDLIVASITVKYTQSNSVGFCKSGMMIGIGAGQQSRIDCVKLAARKAETFWLRLHTKVVNLQFKKGVKKQARVNARIRFIEGDFAKVEFNSWKENFDSDKIPNQLTESEKQDWRSALSDVALSSDAFFPFRDSIDYSSKYGVKWIVQPGGSVADDEVIEACNEYGISMMFSGLRLFHH